MVLYLKSFQVKNIRFSSILQSVSVPVSVFLGIIFFRESTSLFKFVGIFLILLSIVSLNYKNTVLEKNHFADALPVFYLAFVLDNGIVLLVDPLIYMFWVFLLTAFFGFLLKPLTVIRSLKGRGFDAYRLIIVSGICCRLFNLFTYNAYRLDAEVGKVDTINNTQVFLIILFEFFILRHRTSLKRKIFTALLAYAGVILLGMR